MLLNLNQTNSDNQVLEHFNNLSLSLVQRIEREALPASAHFVEATFLALISCGMAERAFRRADRYEIAGFPDDDVVRIRNSAMRLHKGGLEKLADLGTMVDAVFKEWDGVFKIPKNERQNACEEFSLVILKGLVDTEIKPRDVSELKNLLSSISTATMGNRIQARKFVDESIVEFTRLRNLDDRGTIPNIMPWKIVGLAILGISMIVIQMLIAANSRSGAGAAIAGILTGLGGLGGWLAVAIFFC